MTASPMSDLTDALAAIKAMDAAYAVLNATPEWEPVDEWETSRPDDHPESVAGDAYRQARYTATEACIALVRSLAGGYPMPEEMFDSFAVLKELDKKAQQRTSAENVADTLDALARLIRKNATPPTKDQP